MSSADIASLTKLIQDQSALIEKQSHRIGVVEDTEAIRKLHHQYGYYLDKCHYDEVVELFEEDATCTFYGGIYEGKEAIARLYLGRFQSRFVGGRNGPVKGFLLDHFLGQDVITVSADRLSAKMRLRTLMTAGRHRDWPVDKATAPTVPRQWFEGGVYENTYGRKSVDEPWQIRVLNYNPAWHADYSEGWANTPEEYVPFTKTTYPEDPVGPTKVDKDVYLWPDTHTLPFHYTHPISGKAMDPANYKGLPIKEAFEVGKQRTAARAKANGAAKNGINGH